jgi:hypothetical protein
MEIYAVDPAGKAPPAQLTFGGDVKTCVASWTPCGFVEPLPSPNGHDLLYRHTDGSLWLARADGVTPHQLKSVPGNADWSRDSRHVAYPAADGIHVVRADGSHDRVVLPGVVGDVFWSADRKALFVRTRGDLYRFRAGELQLVANSVAGDLEPSPNRRWLMTTSPGQTAVLIDLRARPIRRIALFDKAVAAAWSRDSSRVAVISPTGLWIYEVLARRMRLVAGASDIGYRYEQAIGLAALGLAWSPDGKSIAYIPGGINPQTAGGIESGDLRTLSVNGRLRTVVSMDHAYGGRMLSVAWAPVARGLSYRKPSDTATGPASTDSVLTDGRVVALATDGEHVAFSACNRVFVWTPLRSEVTAVTDVEPPSACVSRVNYGIYGVAVSGSRVLYAETSGCNVITQTLYLKSLDVPDAPRPIATGSGNCGAPYHPFVGELVGDRELLAFSSWQEQADYSGPSTRFLTTRQAIQRVGSEGCPCPETASSSGPLIPADVDNGRIVAFGEQATLLLDRDGEVLVSLPVSPTAAQLSGNDLVLLLRGQLRRYDARDGSLLQTLPLPDVPSGRACWLRCPADQLVLQDARNSLVAYVLDNEIHLLRLADGADKVFAPGQLARFADDGLVYVSGARIRIAPFGRLFR